ncbi:ABC transporter substrate-binding protein [Demequina sp. SYSU T00039]|uniref:ABC transporter substrate-binding protein n=1 Tax=Demequina lignilytica TaxID=3051663 RepID=A0AAW7M8T5_9MICO|nr:MULTISPECIES: ABC transporter substrate-binding protein [unclassified Demequina]MDN4477589.1 ABC transporter substrate-binding protein [Demequina sp. SYSU T00039-1]MDN4488060.1 ABC transporter substrate-binding protein [Demequina sp. SYSU T00039]
MTTRARAALIATASLSALIMAGCSSTSSDSESSASSTPEPTASSAVELETLTEGKLTIATGEPAYEPWVVNDDPASGEGFEAAVAYAVAEELGFAADDVVWVRSSFDSAIAPGAKDWDLNIQQFSITEERKAAVDFSSPYYTTTQAVVTVEGSAAADATTVEALAGLAVGVPSGTTSYTIAAEVLGEDNLSVFNSSEDTVLALNSGQIDAFVIDLPSAFYLAAVELDGGVILGQFEDATGGDEFGFVLPKGSALTEPVTAAVDALREDGTLASIEAEWLSDAVDVPVLK